MSARDDQRWLASLHHDGPGRYRVGASPLVIVRHSRSDWGVYSDSLEGLLRVRGAWAFPTLREARRRAFAVASEYGFGPS